MTSMSRGGKIGTDATVEEVGVLDRGYEVNKEDPTCGAAIACATLLSCGLGGVELESDHANIRCFRFDLYTGLRCCYCKDFCKQGT